MGTRPAASSWADNYSDDSDNDDTSRLLDNNNIGSYRATEQKAIQDHERGLDKLGEAIKRQKYIAGEMATEVELHNEILDGIDTGLTNTNDNLRKNTRNIKLVLKKSSTFYLWFLIIVLGIVIVTLAIL